MLRRCRNKEIRLAVGALYALASLLLVAGHQPRPAQAAADLNAFTLPDGATPVLCTARGLIDGHDDADGSGCEACRLTVAPGLGPVAVPAAPAPSFRRIVQAPAMDVVLDERLAASTAEARAPPAPHSL